MATRKYSPYVIIEEAGNVYKVKLKVDHQAFEVAEYREEDEEKPEFAKQSAEWMADMLTKALDNLIDKEVRKNEIS